jgi:hypothetical protein
VRATRTCPFVSDSAIFSAVASLCFCSSSYVRFARSCTTRPSPPSCCLSRDPWRLLLIGPMTEFTYPKYIPEPQSEIQNGNCHSHTSTPPTRQSSRLAIHVFGCVAIRQIDHSVSPKISHGFNGWMIRSAAGQKTKTTRKYKKLRFHQPRSEVGGRANCSHSRKRYMRRLPQRATSQAWGRLLTLADAPDYANSDGTPAVRSRTNLPS